MIIYLPTFSRMLRQVMYDERKRRLTTAREDAHVVNGIWNIFEPKRAFRMYCTVCIVTFWSVLQYQ